MPNVKVNYSTLLSSSTILETSVQDAKPKTQNLPDIRQRIESLGKNHDNCLSPLSDDIEYDLDKAITEVSELANDMYITVNLFSQAELAIIDNIKIESTGLDNALQTQYTNTFNTSLTGYDYEYYQSLFDKTISLATSERSKTTMAALFLATSFPHMNYFWGGGHDKIVEGLDPTWGQEKEVTSPKSVTTGTTRPNSLDCSGYVSWALKNGGYDIDQPMSTWELEEIGQKVPITSAASNNVQVGDLAAMNNHVGIIVKVDENEITVSHCSGNGGMSITKIDTTTGLVTEDWNQEAESRVGQPYFTDIIKVNYKD